MEHGDASEDRMIIGYDENIMIYHSADEKEEKSETQEGKTSEEKTEEDEETVEQIFHTLSEKQKNVIYAMFGQAFGEPDKPEDKNDPINPGTGVLVTGGMAVLISGAVMLISKKKRK